MKRCLFLTTSVLLAFFSSVSNAQIITTFAGTGAVGYSGDNGPATAATFSYIKAMCSDTAGNLYLPDYNTNVIRKITPAGIITTIGGNGSAGFSGDGGPATAAKLDGPWGVTTDKAGNIYFVEHGNNIVRKINAAGIISTFAGNTSFGYTGDGGPATNATFWYPGHLATDDVGNVYISDGNNVIRKVNAAGIVTTFAGTGMAGYNGDGIAATSAQLNNPINILWSKTGSLYISDNVNNRIRKVNPSGIISTVAGNGILGNSGDGGPATAAQINGQIAMAFDTAGNLYLSLFDNNVIRKVTGTTINTIIGNGTLGFSGDGGSPLLAELAHPHGIVVDKKNQIFFVDQDNNRVRKVSSVITYVHNTNSLEDKINIYPNSANTWLNIVSTGNIDHVVISNLLGQVVYDHKGKALQLQVDVSGFPAGIYLVKINDLKARRLIKQ